MAPEVGPPLQAALRSLPRPLYFHPSWPQTIQSHLRAATLAETSPSKQLWAAQEATPLHAMRAPGSGPQACSATRCLTSRPGGQDSGIASSSLEFRHHLGILFCPRHPSQVLPLPPEPSARGSHSSRSPTSAQVPKAHHHLVPGTTCQFLRNTLTIGPDLPPGTFTSHPFQPELSSGSPTSPASGPFSTRPTLRPSLSPRPQHKLFRDKGRTSQAGLTSEERQSLGAR